MTDPATALLRLRAQIARLSHEVDALADLRGIANVRVNAPILADRIRAMVMANGVVEAEATAGAGCGNE